MEVGIELAARLCQKSQGRQCHTCKTQAVEHRIGIGNAVQVRDMMRAEQIPETALRDPLIRQHNGCTDREMRIDDGQSIDIVHRQIRNRTVSGSQVEIVYDCLRIRTQISIALPHELRAARRARGRHEEREILVQRNILPLTLHKHIAALRENRMIFRILHLLVGGQPEIDGLIAREQALLEYIADPVIHHHGHNARMYAGRIGNNSLHGVGTEQKEQTVWAHSICEGLRHRPQFPISIGSIVGNQSCMIGKFIKVKEHKSSPLYPSWQTTARKYHASRLT